MVLADVGDLSLDLAALFDEKAVDGVAKAGIADPMCRIGLDRHIAAGELVRPLRPGFDARQAAGDGDLDRLVVANLEPIRGSRSARPTWTTL